MKHLKHFGVLFLALCMLFTLAPAAMAADSSIQLTLDSNTMIVNGEEVAIDADPAIKPQVKNGGYTMLPLRAVVESLGGTVAYDPASKVITLTYKDNVLEHTLGTANAAVNGEAKTMAIASYAENNRTYVHLRAIELLSPEIQVLWSAEAPKEVKIVCIPARVPAEVYEFDLSGEDIVVENQIFDGDVVISGENGVISFFNCEFNGYLINAGGEGARVSIMEDCVFAEGVACVLETTIVEATMETDLPKFFIFCEMPEVICETSGAIVTTADKPIRLNGEEFPIESATHYLNEETGEIGEYAGQEAAIQNYSMWIENGVKVVYHFAI